MASALAPCERVPDVQILPTVGRPVGSFSARPGTPDPKTFARSHPGAWLARVKPTQAIAGALLAVLAAGCAHAPEARAGASLDRVMSLGDFDHALLSTAIFEESNRVREAHGSPPLGHLAALDAAADEQASYLALSLSVGHRNPFLGERDEGERVIHEGLDPARVGENAIMMPAAAPGSPGGGYTYASYAAFLVEGWMDSPEHRETLLARRFTHLGCAARLAHGFAQGDQRIFAVQEFFRPADRKMASPEGAARH